MTKKERYQKVFSHFEQNESPAETELHYHNPFELLVAVILSAQCTDKRVNLVTPRLFRDYPNAEAMASASPDTLFNYIKSISYPNNKAKHLSGMARMLIDKFGGVIPREVDQLTLLPGVGRKTANVIASVVYQKPTMAVDTHVFRVANRIGLTTRARNPLQSEKQLINFIPEQLIPKAHHWLILHGRYVCTARNPKCASCALKLFCKYFEENNKSKSILLKTTKLKKQDHGKKNKKEKSRKESHQKGLQAGKKGYKEEGHKEKSN